MIDASNHNPKAIWPGSKKFEQHKINLEDESVTSSWVQMDLHYGTHIDSPLHHIENGDTVDKFPTSLMKGKCQVIECDGDFDFNEDINDHTNEPFEAKAVFLKFKDHDLNKEFNPDFNGLTMEGLNCLKQYNIELIGTNYLSIEKFDSDGSIHKELLGNNIWILESLNLENVESGIYDYYCFPLKLESEASPVRVMLEKYEY